MAFNLTVIDPLLTRARIARLSVPRLGDRLSHRRPVAADRSMHAQASERPTGGARFWLPLAGILLIGLLARVTLVLSDFGFLDADEAIVGLMARHILAGERPSFYWGQGYMGPLEAYSAAALFALMGPSAVALKLAPVGYSLAFVLLSAVVARRLFGSSPALLAAAYLALPPMMLALWSIKARGGYAEM